MRHKTVVDMRLFITVVLLCIAAGAQQLSPQSNSGNYRVGVGVSEPRCDYTPDPQYTEEARKANIKGTVVFWTTVGIDGCLHDSKLVRKLGFGLDEAAAKVLPLWHCKPSLKNGEPVATAINIELNFDPTYAPTEQPSDVKPCTERMANNGTQSKKTP